MFRKVDAGSGDHRKHELFLAPTAWWSENFAHGGARREAEKVGYGILRRNSPRYRHP